MMENKICMDSPPLRREYGRLAATALIVAALVLLYKDTFAWLVHIYWNDKENSHGFLVPFVSLYLLWRKRKYLLRQPSEPQMFYGSVTVLGSMFLYLAGRSTGFVIAEAVSFLFLLPGLILLFKGWEYLKICAMPLLYLQFMVPWAEELTDRFHAPFQYFSAWLGVLLLDGIGIPAFLDGNFIYLPNMTLEVAKECSGVRFLTSVVALGLPLVYLTQTKWKRAIAVVASGVLITILMNGVRIALGATLAYRYNSDLLHGPFHILQGALIAQVGFVMLAIINWRVARKYGKDAPTLCDRWKTFARNVPGAGRSHRDGAWKTAGVLGALLVVLAYSHYYSEPKPVPSKTVHWLFPEVVRRWKGTDRLWIRGETYFPGVDSQVARLYTDGNGSEIFYYSGYFEVQKHGKTVSGFHANPFHDGAVNMKTGFLEGPKNIETTEIVISGVKYRIFSWYRLGSRYLSGRYTLKAWTISDTLLHGRNNAVVYILGVSSRDNKQEGGLDELMDFISYAVNNSD
jgi:exosortase